MDWPKMPLQTDRTTSLGTRSPLPCTSTQYPSAYSHTLTANRACGYGRVVNDATTAGTTTIAAGAGAVWLPHRRTGRWWTDNLRRTRTRPCPACEALCRATSRATTPDEWDERAAERERTKCAVCSTHLRPAYRYARDIPPTFHGSIRDF